MGEGLTEVTVYQTEDGSIHESREEALLRAQELRVMKNVDAFLASKAQYQRHAEATRARKAILAWEVWKQENK